MFKLNKDYKDREVLFQRLILFTAGLILVIVYFGHIVDFVSYILAICSPFFIGAALAFIFATISNTLMNAYIKTGKGKPGTASWFVCNTLSLAVVFALIALFLFLILPHAIDSFQHMSATLPEGIYDLYDAALKASRNIPYIHNWLIKISPSLENLPSILDSLGSWILSGGATGLITNIYDVISTTFSWIVTLFIALAFSIILLFNKNHAAREFNTLARAYIPKNKYPAFMHVVHMIKQTFTHYISGTCTECLILGFLVTFFSLLFRLPYSFLCGIVVGVGALVPMFGALAGAILMTLFIAITSPLQALYFIILFICIQNVEGNFIYPHVVGRFVEFPPMYVIIAVTVGANLAGVAGMIISIPICSIIYQLVKQDANKRISDSGFGS